MIFNESEAQINKNKVLITIIGDTVLINEHVYSGFHG